jgi:hypothetical protein
MHFCYRSTSFFIPSKKKLSVAHEATSAPLAGRHHASRTCATRVNVFSDQGIHPLDVLVRAWCRLSSVTLVLPFLKRSIHPWIFRWCMVRAPAAILLPSLLSAMWLNDGMLRAVSYTSSLAQIWCCASATLSCFYRSISKLSLLSDSPTYIHTHTLFHIHGAEICKCSLSTLVFHHHSSSRYMQHGSAVDWGTWGTWLWHFSATIINMV